MTDPDTPRETVPAVSRKRYLIAFMDREAAESLLAGSPGTTEDPAAAYERAREAVEPVERPPTGRAVDPLPDEAAVREHVSAFRDTAAFRQVVGGDGENGEDCELGLVPVDALVAFQTGVETTAHRDLPTWADDRLALLRACLPLSGDDVEFSSTLDTPEGRRLGVQFTARSPNVQVARKRVEHREGGGVDVTFEVRAKPNFVHVVRYRDRLLLKNGYHRAYRVAVAGGDRIPAVVRDVDDYAATGGDHSRNFDEERVLADRPPLLVDFDTPAAAEVLRPARNKVIKCVAETDWVPR